MKLLIYKHRVYKLIEVDDKVIIEPAEFIEPSDLDGSVMALVETTEIARLIPA